MNWLLIRNLFDTIPAWLCYVVQPFCFYIGEKTFNDSLWLFIGMILNIFGVLFSNSGSRGRFHWIQATLFFGGGALITTAVFWFMYHFAGPIYQAGGISESTANMRSIVDMLIFLTIDVLFLGAITLGVGVLTALGRDVRLPVIGILAARISQYSSSRWIIGLERKN